jgi:hypothetical protein
MSCEDDGGHEYEYGACGDGMGWVLFDGEDVLVLLLLLLLLVDP